MAADKMRVHILAKELNVSAKTIIEKCRAEGIDSVKNHMSTLSAGLHATILEWFSSGTHDTAVETAAPVDLDKIRRKSRSRRRPAEGQVAEGENEFPGASESAGETATLVAEPPVSLEPAETEIVALEPEPGHTPEMETVVQPIEDVSEPQASPDVESSQAVKDQEPAQAEVAAVAFSKSPEPVVTPVDEAPTTRKPVTPAGPQNVPVPAKLQGPRVVRYEAPEPNVYRPQRPSPFGARRASTDGGPVGPSVGTDVGKPSDKTSPQQRRKGRASPRHATGRLAESGERIAEWRDQDILERQERLATATGRKIHHRRSAQVTSPTARQQTPTGPRTQATVHEPVRMKEFCAATGLNFLQLVKVMKDEFSLPANVNMTLPSETAVLLALHFGIELEVVPSKTRLDELAEEFAAHTRNNLEPRPPVVTILGHVDHGKTSLLDAIRTARVAAGEDGGITQHIGAYYVETSHGPVTFLDTPGHEAFTAMRARGAQLTDVVVLVVAADDGIMPQTVEAINHAKAANVPIVVALNKIDLGDQNKLKIYGQLSERGLTPSGDWGGHTDVMPTSALTGEGVTELVEHLADLSSVLELKADSALPGCGAVIEAEVKPGVGPVARVLVQEGTLRVGDIVVCGNACGKIRALLDDRGERVREVKPGMPIEIWGLDDVPSAGDKLYQVDNMQRASDIAGETKQRRIEQSRMQSTKVASLEEMFSQRDASGIPELNVVIKADVDGSVAALRQMLTKLPTDEVRLGIRHTGVGAVNDSDILLAAACRGIVVAFRVDTSIGARRLADQHGVEIRPYRVIYDVYDDIKKAMEGLLAPEEKLESRGVIEVRQVFNISKVGVVAGSFVAQGTVERNHWVRVVRDGVIVRERCRFASLRRFKDDVREVRSGMECGVRLEDFSDLHVGDQLESYEIVKISRTL